MLRFLLTLLLSALALGHAQAQPVATRAYAAADGKGGARLLWFVRPELWRPGGFRIEDDRGRVLVPRIAAGEPEFMAKLGEADQRQIRELTARAGKPGARGAADDVLLGGRVLADWDFARAAGLAVELAGLEPRRTSFVIRGLDARGEADRSQLRTAPLNLAAAAPVPRPPMDLRAVSGPQGVALHWRPQPQALPVLAYWVERDSGQAVQTLTGRPLLLGNTWDAARPAYNDTTAPVEEEVAYRVYAVDALGRRSEPAMVRVFHPDHRALLAPEALRAQAEDGRVVLEWSASRNPNTAGYALERSLLPDGPFELLTRKPLPVAAARFEDAGVRGGTAYFYRIRAMDPRGELGSPSDSVMAQPLAKTRPGAPEGLAADVGRTRVRLTWAVAPASVAGYLVEREDGGNWFRLNVEATPQPRHDDHYGAGRGGEVRYRVIAVGSDGQMSEPSRELRVTLPDTLPPAPPRIRDARAEGGRVLLEFAPAEGEEVREFLVLRSGDPREPGLVVGDPLPASARRFEDSGVAAGEAYWYRVASVDSAGNRGEPGAATAVRVVPPAIPRAAKPRLALAREPFRHTRIAFDAPPDGLTVMVQRRRGAGPWVVLAGPLQGPGETVDANLPDALNLEYRLVYCAATGAEGPASDPARP
jgi:hypothetical protein